jgi:hypothetical protein
LDPAGSMLATPERGVIVQHADALFSMCGHLNYA